MALKISDRHHLLIPVLVWQCTIFGALAAGSQFAEPAWSASDSGSPAIPVDSRSFSGNVSWYGPGLQGRKTASGELFDMLKPTAAHRTLPLNVRVLVEDPQTGKSAVVKVNDRGPFVKTRVMDLSREGGRQLGILSRGVTYADCLVLDQKSAAASQGRDGE